VAGVVVADVGAVVVVGVYQGREVPTTTVVSGSNEYGVRMVTQRVCVMVMVLVVML